MTPSRFIKSKYGSKKGLIRHISYSFIWRLTPNICFPDIPKDTQRLIFICKGNICRSALAKTIAQDIGIPTESYGLQTDEGHPANSKMSEIAKKHGYDLQSHRTQSIKSYQPKAGDLALVMEIEHHQSLRKIFGNSLPSSLLGLWSSSPRAHLQDPYGCSDEYFQTCYKMIYTAVINLNKTMQQD